MIKYDEKFNILNTVSQIFELDEEVTRHETDNYTHKQLMLCEENSSAVDTLQLHGMVYIEYKFKDNSYALLIVLPPILPQSNI